VAYLHVHVPCRSIIELAQARGYAVTEEPVTVHEAMEVRDLKPDWMHVAGNDWLPAV
jgi:hypothetical protein